jgi:hypothetical protein
MSVVSQAAAMLNALSSPSRLALLVDLGQLTRDGAADYRRAG